tara:strand:+ start:88 stop:426 length:339 start_codon:yes stop_codon:yes gene_type:complete
MEFYTHLDYKIKVAGTSFLSYLNVSYSELVEVFGEPKEGDGYKIDSNWEVEFEDGAVATIYNYKTGINYLGVEGQHKEHIRIWHIGGHSNDVIDRIFELLENNSINKENENG